MINYILEKFYPSAPPTYRKTLIAQTSENTLIPIMQMLSKEIDFSSLPMINDGKATVEISVASTDEPLCIYNFELFIADLEKKSIDYMIIESIN
jgi:hypothetical protein